MKTNKSKGGSKASCKSKDENVVKNEKKCRKNTKVFILDIIIFGLYLLLKHVITIVRIFIYS